MIDYLRIKNYIDEFNKRFILIEDHIMKHSSYSEIKKHLENLGFVIGGHITVISTLGGNVIVNVKEARIAISEELAKKIMV